MRGMVLGAGMTGLAVGTSSGFPVFEASAQPGGICRSYFLCAGQTRRLTEPPADGEAYRFEVGGGHWIFGGCAEVNALLARFGPMPRYQRRSGVFFADERRVVPYPLQHHLRYLPEGLGRQVLDELEAAAVTEHAPSATLAGWLEHSFGPTLGRRFFAPYHERYTAGLWREVAPEDDYKSPLDLDAARRGLAEDVPGAGYNAEFVYPECGLDGVARGMAASCNVALGKRAVRIDTAARRVHFADGDAADFEHLVSTLPLRVALDLADVAVTDPPDPHTSVLVLNLGAAPGPACPREHWLYVPRSRAGFFRVGFYSNVDDRFLPRSRRHRGERASLYVERAFPGGRRPDPDAIARYAADAVDELRSWGFIGEVEALDSNWVEVAYTWRRPGSRWREQGLEALAAHGIHSAGRYARWRYQGIARSIREGLRLGASLRA